MIKKIFLSSLCMFAATMSAFAQLQPRETFGAYVLGLQQATTVGPTDLLYILQGGVSRSIPGSFFATSLSISGLTGDATATGPGTVPLTLATVNASVGSFGSPSSVPSFTVNAKGLITAASTSPIAAPAGTLSGSSLAPGVLASSLTSVGVLTGGATGVGFTVDLGSSTINGLLDVANGGTGAASFTVGLPILGNGTASLTQGTLSGNTSTFATATGVLTTGHCVSIDGAGNFIDAGGACTTGGGGGTVSAGTANQIGYYATSSTTISGNADVTAIAGALTLGLNTSVLGTIRMNGNTSGSLLITPQAAAGTPTWTAGTSSGTPAVTASPPLTITTATGNVTCATCATSSTIAPYQQAALGGI